MLGSQENFERFYNKSIVELKDEFRIAIKEQLLANKVRSTITQDVKVSPSEVKTYFEAIPEDSIPFFNTQVEIAQIVIFPKVNPVIEAYTLEKAKQIKQRIKNGEDFSFLASAYSEDPGSAMRGGELDFMHRTELVPEFAEVAFKLKKDSISDIVESSFGYHIIQGIERETSQKINKVIKDSKLKLQVAIRGEEIRVSGQKRDKLQDAIQMIKNMDIKQPLQFINFRD